MAVVTVVAEGHIDAPARLVYDVIADFREHHPRFLPPSFTDFDVEQGGVGAGTVARSRFGRPANARLPVRIDEPEPGRVLTETDTMSSLVTTWTSRQTAAVLACALRPTGRRLGRAWFLRAAVRAARVRRLYRDELRRLDRYARQQARQRETVATARRRQAVILSAAKDPADCQGGL